MRSPTVFRWAEEERIPGCDLAFAPGEVCRFGPWLTKPHGRLYFVGTERSSWLNNMEGALESGERAAREISERQPVALVPDERFSPPLPALPLSERCPGLSIYGSSITSTKR